jgi:segregation and condensation protein B
VNEELSSPEDSQPGPGEDTSLETTAAAVDREDAAYAAGSQGGRDDRESPRSSSSDASGEDSGSVGEAERNGEGPGENGGESDEGDAVEETPVWIPEPDKLLLSLLFASHEYLDARGLREIMGPEWDTPRLRMLVRKLNRELEASETPFEIAETEGSFRLRTLPKYFPWTRKLFKEGAPRRLSQAALETLAIVAYKQPVTKAEIESIRGVNVDGSMKTLLDKKLIDIGRRSDALGQAFTYHTTRDFMRYFGISRVPDDLPRLSEFEGILNAQSLIPQMGTDGEIHEVVRDDESGNGEQLTLGMDGAGTDEE